MKVLFLDIDGVLTTSASEWDSFRKCHTFIQECVTQLQRVIQETECQIVVSSDWRHRGERWVTDILARHSITVHDITPKTGKRHEEIQQWLDANDVSTYCIVDDNYIQMPNLVQTSYSTGLCVDTANQIIQTLTSTCITTPKE